MLNIDNQIYLGSIVFFTFQIEKGFQLVVLSFACVAADIKFKNGNRFD